MNYAAPFNPSDFVKSRVHGVDTAAAHEIEADAVIGVQTTFTELTGRIMVAMIGTAVKTAAPAQAPETGK